MKRKRNMDACHSSNNKYKNNSLERKFGYSLSKTDLSHEVGYRGAVFFYPV